LRGQTSLEYVFAMFFWVIVCTTIAYAVSPYITALSSQFSIAANTAALQSISEVADSGLEGLRFSYTHAETGGNFSFNNTISSLQTGSGKAIMGSSHRYNYSDHFEPGDRMLIRIRDGDVLVVEVS
jgi:uncharacterized protein (UPF0333 family)